MFQVEYSQHLFLPLSFSPILILFGTLSVCVCVCVRVCVCACVFLPPSLLPLSTSSFLPTPSLPPSLIISISHYLLSRNSLTHLGSVISSHEQRLEQNNTEQSDRQPSVQRNHSSLPHHLGDAVNRTDVSTFNNIENCYLILEMLTNCNHAMLVFFSTYVIKHNYHALKSKMMNTHDIKTSVY